MEYLPHRLTRAESDDLIGLPGVAPATNGGLTFAFRERGLVLLTTAFLCDCESFRVTASGATATSDGDPRFDGVVSTAGS
jgi:hypothetical protein